jgi:glycosyltransferase involved in cell wall biosynthesis
MKIAVWHNLPSGGGKRWLHDHAKALARRGHSIEVWCPDTADVDFLPISGFCKENIRPLEATVIPWWKRRGNAIVEMNARVDSMKAHCRAVATEIDQSGAEILLATSCRAFYVPYIGLYSRLPKVVYLHEPYRPLYEAMASLLWKAPARLQGPRQALSELRARLNEHCHTYAARIQAREEYQAAASYDRILVNSLFSRESVLRAYGLDSEVCYPGIDIHEASPDEVPGGTYVAGMGSVTFNKGIERAVRALATIPPERRPELRWIANYSDPAHETAVRELAERHGVRMQLLHQISDAQARAVLAGAALFVYAPRLEPFGLSPLEANACGTPVVALAEGGVRETIQDGINGVLVHDSAPASLGAAIDGLLRDDERREEMSRTALQCVYSNWSMLKAQQDLETKIVQVTSSFNI